MKLYIHLMKICVRLFLDEKALCFLREMFYLTYLCTSGVFPEPTIVLETTSCMFGSWCQLRTQSIEIPKIGFLWSKLRFFYAKAQCELHSSFSVS